MSKPPQRRAGGRSLVKAGGAKRLEGVALNREIATTHDGRDITRPWVHELEEYRDVRLQGALDWGVYDRILLDDQVKSCFEQRRSAVVSREWNVLSGDDSDPRANAAAQALEDNLKEVGWDKVTDKMLYATFNGISAAELGWGPWRGMIGWVQNGRARPIHVRHARRFRYDKEGRLRLITQGNPTGEILPERKFWVVKTGASDDDEPYGRGLAEWLYWPTLFKRNGIRFWNIFLDKFSVPPVKGVYPRGTSEPEIQKLLSAMMALANDSGIAVPEGVLLEFMQVATNGIDFEKMPAFMDAAIAKIILSQTMTTDDGSSRAQGQVHAGVKQELIVADADLLTDSFTEGPARWFTDLNFGTDVAAPIVTRQVEEEEDTRTTAETDEALARIGYRRTEESFQDTYGDGYERKEPAEPVHGGGGGGGRRPSTAAPEAANDQQAEPGRAVSFAAGDRRSLHVHRRLKNAKALIAWAKQQGFKSTLPASELHVTVTYSRRPVDWFEMGQAWGSPDGGLTIPAGGPRQIERLGDEGAVVLLFASSELAWRNEEMRGKGAEWTHADYHPHITITYDAPDLDLSAVEAYQGELIFGPEVFEPIDDGYEADEVSFAEAAIGAEGDIVDQAAAAIMADEGWRQVADELGVNELLAELAAAGNPEDVAAILAREAKMGDMGPLTERLERAGFAVRMAGATGADQ